MTKLMHGIPKIIILQKHGIKLIKILQMHGIGKIIIKLINETEKNYKKKLKYIYIYILKKFRYI